MDINWEEPGPRKAWGNRGGTGRWQKFVAELKKRPGQWALVGEGVGTSTGYQLRKYGAQVSIRGGKRGAYRVERMYARWPGESE